MSSTTIGTYVYTFAAPRAAPLSGSAWDEEIDLPGVSLEVRLPCNPGHPFYLRDDLLAPDTLVFGAPLSIRWGNLRKDGDENFRWLRHMYRGGTVAESLEMAQKAASIQEGILRRMAKARQTRLRLRREAIIKSCSDTGGLDIPPEYQEMVDEESP